MQSRPGRFQLVLPRFLASKPEEWAKINHWFTTMRHPDFTDGYRAHTSFSVSCAIAALDSLPYAERQALLLKGAQRIFSREREDALPGRERVRIYRGKGVSPKGISAAA